MKICHIVPSLEEQYGGPSKSVRSLCRALAGTGITVDILTTAPNAPRVGSTEIDGALRIHTFRRDWPQRLCVSSGLRAALAASEADVIHHHALWLRTLHYARVHANRRSVPLIVSPRGMMSTWAWYHHHWRKQLSRVLVHPRALTRISGWHATSAEEQTEIRQLGFRQPICVAPNGVDAPSANSIAEAKAYWHRKCPETATRRTALFYSRFHQKKRVLELIDTWLACAPADWLLLLVGIPEDYTPEMLELYVHRQSAGGRVRALSGAGQPKPYAVASLFVLPSHNENFGLVIAEALAHGVPAVVTDTTPWQGLNADQRGWCVPWDEFGRTLASATAESRETLLARGKRSRTWVLQEFSWERAAHVLVEFYSGFRSNVA